MKMMIAILAASLCSSAAAADLTVNQCLVAGSGIAALRFAGATLNDLRTPASTSKFYKFSGATLWALAQDAVALQRKADAFQRTRSDLMRDIGGGKPIVPGSPEMDRLTDELQKVLDGKCDARLKTITRADLRAGEGADDNQIPIDVLGALVPLVSDWDAQ